MLRRHDVGSRCADCLGPRFGGLLSTGKLTEPKRAIPPDRIRSRTFKLKAHRYRTRDPGGYDAAPTDSHRWNRAFRLDVPPPAVGASRRGRMALDLQRGLPDLDLVVHLLEPVSAPSVRQDQALKGVPQAVRGR